MCDKVATLSREKQQSDEPFTVNAIVCTELHFNGEKNNVFQMFFNRV